MDSDIPQLPIDAAMDDPNQDEDTISPEKRRPMRLLDALVQPEGELSDSEDEGEGGRRDHKRHRDPESVTEGLGRRFGVGVGIMGGGSTAAAGAGSGGPSVHTTVETIVRRKSDVDAAPADMDVDEPSSPGLLSLLATAIAGRGSPLTSALGGKESAEDGEATSSGNDITKDSKGTSVPQVSAKGSSQK